MKFSETTLRGAFVIEPEKLEDERGFFARLYCQQEFAARKLNTRWVQCNISFNKKRHTVRGMHWQESPHPEIKLIRCTHGAVHDVIVDLRTESDTYRQWVAIELTETNARLLYVPERFAHGYQTLTDNVEVFYQMSEFYHPECARGARWDNPEFGIEWPFKPTIISSRDQGAR